MWSCLLTLLDCLCEVNYNDNQAINQFTVPAMEVEVSNSFAVFFFLNFRLFEALNSKVKQFATLLALGNLKCSQFEIVAIKLYISDTCFIFNISQISHKLYIFWVFK